MFAKVLMMTDAYFRKISFSQKVQLISRCLGLRDPAIVQGMYIFKNPGIGRADTSECDNGFIRAVDEPSQTFPVPREGPY